MRAVLPVFSKNLRRVMADSSASCTISSAFVSALLAANAMRRALRSVPKRAVLELFFHLVDAFLF
jgi:hypothetical protein